MRPNIALLGCGAIAQAFYLPALSRLRANFDRIWLVDPNDDALTTAATFVRGDRVRSFSEVSGDLHFLIIAVPNGLHFSSAMRGLEANAHVLIEKPFVIWPEEGRQLITKAESCNRVVAINQTRRFYPITQNLRRRIGVCEFGELKSIEHDEGVKLNWPFESGASFGRNAQRTGVIMDFGVHVIDFYQYLLNPSWTFASGKHDGFCGPEGLAEFQLEANGVPVSIRLSRYQTQRNVARLSFEKVDIFIDVYDCNTYFTRDRLGKIERFKAKPSVRSYGAFAEPVLLNFLAAGENRGSVICGAASSLPVIDILDQIYRRAERYPATVGAA